MLFRSTLSEGPRRVRDVWDLDRIEVGRVKGSALLVGPGEGSVMRADDPFSEFDFFGEKEILAECHLVATFLSETTGGREVGRLFREGEEIGKWVRVLSANNAKVLGKSGRDGSSLVRYLFVEEGGFEGVGYDGRPGEGSREPHAEGLSRGEGGRGIGEGVSQSREG